MLCAPCCLLLNDCKQEQVSDVKETKLARKSRCVLKKWLQRHSNLLCHKQVTAACG